MAGETRTYTVFLSPMHVVNVIADQVDTHGSTLVFRKDSRIVGQFQAWTAYAEHEKEAKEPATVLALVPGSPPAPGAA